MALVVLERVMLGLSGVYNPDDVIVLLTAFTGMAALNIDGMTLHSAFLLVTGPNKRNYQGLGSERLYILRARLSKMRLLIIDEVSMVGADMLY